MLKKEVILEGLDGANCSAKIETLTKNLDGVNNASVDFVSKKLTMEVADNKDLNKILEEVTGIEKKIEPNVKLVDAYKNKRAKSIIILEGLG